MKIIAILASGTGGHIYPALCIAEEYIKRGYKILWIGTPNGLEDKIIDNQNIIIEKISSQGIRGKTTIKKLISIVNVFKSIFQSISIFRRYRPSMVLGFGGYVSAVSYTHLTLPTKA